MFCNCIPADDDDNEEELDEIFGGKWVEFIFPLMSTAKKERSLSYPQIPKGLEFPIFLDGFVQKGNHEITSKRGAQGSKSLISSA
jgi:hypothetical protein